MENSAAATVCVKCQQPKAKGELDSRSRRYAGVCRACRRASVAEFRSTKMGYFRSQLDKIGRVPRRRDRIAATEKDLCDIWDAQGGRCAITGREMKHEYNPDKERHADSAAIDLIDGMMGYAPSNIRLVCHFVHLMKGRMPLAAFVSACKEITEYRAGSRAPSSTEEDTEMADGAAPQDTRWADMV
eukprot:jgi/Mesvir1/10449/Mv12080-RA.1